MTRTGGPPVLPPIGSRQKVTLGNLLYAVAVPDAVRESIMMLRSRLAQGYTHERLRPKDVGLTGLTNPDEQRTGRKLLDDIARYGIFPTPVGELGY